MFSRAKRDNGECLKSREGIRSYTARAEELDGSTDASSDSNVEIRREPTRIIPVSHLEKIKLIRTRIERCCELRTNLMSVKAEVER